MNALFFLIFYPFLELEIIEFYYHKSLFLCFTFVIGLFLLYFNYINLNLALFEDFQYHKCYE